MTTIDTHTTNANINVNSAAPSAAPREAHQKAVFAGTDDIFGDVISTYTRQQAIDDGFLIDVSETAKEARFTVPAAITAACWADCVEWSKEDTKRQTYQDEAGRLWDVLWMLSLAARRGGSVIRYQLYRVPRGGRGQRPRLTTLKAVIGPGDNHEPVITVMLPGED
jgi:hypothetical protein